MINYNSKLEKDGILKFSLPMLKTCPGADRNNPLSICSRCYCEKALAMYPSVGPCHDRNLQATKQDNFVQVMVDKLNSKLRHSKKFSAFFRWHDSGDVYSMEYLAKIFEICRRTPAVSHYMYTKSHHFFLQDNGRYRFTLPKNFRVIHSLGSKYDYLVNPKRHRHAFAFKSYDDMLAMNYVDCSKSDMVAATTKSLCIGLIDDGK